MSTGRNTTTRDRDRRTIAKGQPDCYHCQQPINYQAHYLDPLAYQVDHRIPLDLGGTDTLDNKVPSHRVCNRAKSNKHPDIASGAITYITDRNWWAAAA